jgi:hypothetical protein
MFFRSTASAMASASTKSFLFDFTNGFTNCAAINRTSWPCLRNARPRKCAPEQASSPISEFCRFAVYVSSCRCVNFFFTSTLPAALSAMR